LQQHVQDKADCRRAIPPKRLKSGSIRPDYCLECRKRVEQADRESAGSSVSRQTATYGISGNIRFSAANGATNQKDCVISNGLMTDICDLKSKRQIELK